jgi:DNA-binding transcriptional MerR regulator
MSTETSPNRFPLQRFSTEPDAYYPIDVAARLAEMPRHVLLVCCRLGIVEPRIDPNFGGFSFHQKDIQSLQHIEYLRSGCGVNLAGIQIILELLDEVQQLRALLRD